MVFCNKSFKKQLTRVGIVTILILIDGFLQYCKWIRPLNDKGVTILILIDGFLQLMTYNCKKCQSNSHNPYFNRWFSAI